MDGADDEVTGEAGLNGDGGRFGIANLADHDHLRVLAHERAQRDWIRKFLVRVDLRLADHRQIEFHRVLDGADADGWTGALHQMIERRVDCRGLARTGRAGQQNQSAGPRQELDERLQCFLLEAEAAEIKTPVAGIKNADDDFFPSDGREDRDAEFDPAEFGVCRRVAFLGQVCLIGNEIGHDLEATGDFLHEIERQVDQLIQNSIEADADRQRALPGLDVDVAGAQFDGVDKQVIDQGADFNALLVGD